MRIVFPLALLGALAGCSPQPSEPSPRATGTPQAGNEAERVAELNDPQRRAVFLRAIRDAGNDCQQVVEAVLLDAEAARWRARCGDGIFYLVTLRADGTAIVTGRTQ